MHTEQDYHQNMNILGQQKPLTLLTSPEHDEDEDEHDGIVRMQSKEFMHHSVQKPNIGNTYQHGLNKLINFKQRKETYIKERQNNLMKSL